MKTKIFRFIWRSNAVFIFAAGVLALIFLVIFGIHMLNWALRDREVQTVVNTDLKQQIEESLTLGGPEHIAGHPWMLVPLNSDQSYDQGSYSKSASAVRNYAFVSAADSTRWLYPHNQFLILEARQLPSDRYDDEQPKSCISFEVIEKDTDGDKRLTAADLSKLVFTRPDGTGMTTMLEDVSHVVAQKLVGDDIMVIYKNDTGYARVIFSLKDFSRLREEKLEYPKGAAGS